MGGASLATKRPPQGWMVFVGTTIGRPRTGNARPYDLTSKLDRLCRERALGPYVLKKELIK